MQLDLGTLVVPDYDDAVECFRDVLGFVVVAGVELVGPVREESYGTLQVFRDPFGNLWDLLSG